MQQAFESSRKPGRSRSFPAALCGSCPDDEGARHHPDSHSVCRPYAHLDTQWRWEFPQTISEYLLKTMRVNFDYIDQVPALCLQLDRREPISADEGVFPCGLRANATVRCARAAGILPVHQSRKATSIFPARRVSFVRSFMAMNIFARTSERPARNICCLTVLAFLPLFPASSRTPA